MDILYPSIRRDLLPVMIRITLLGAILAGIYGALHDQVSYTISEEYFTKLKFHQFAYANFGLHPRLFAAEVGFLASWWVGLIAAWLLARLGLAEMPQALQRTRMYLAFAIVAVTAILTGAIGALLGAAQTASGDLSAWNEWQRALGLRNLRAFVIVAYLHNGSYLGGLLGLIAAAIYVRRRLGQQ